jgi:hypothetical protein
MSDLEASPQLYIPFGIVYYFCVVQKLGIYFATKLYSSHEYQNWPETNTIFIHTYVY